MQISWPIIIVVIIIVLLLLVLTNRQNRKDEKELSKYLNEDYRRDDGDDLESEE